MANSHIDRGRRVAESKKGLPGDEPTRPNDPKTLKDLLRAMNLEGVDLTRDPSPTRDIDL